MVKPDLDTAVTAEVAGKVFISYASQDLAIAEILCAALEVANLPCWIAPRNVRAGESYAAAIVQAINSCRMLVLVLSKNAAASGHVLREVERASSKQRPVLSVRMDTGELPPELEYFLSANHWLDATAGPVEQILPALVESVRGGSGEPPPRTTALASRNPTRSGWRLPAVALAVAVIGLGYLVAHKFWSSQHAVGAEPAAPSIAVLPFSDLSAEGNQGYFSDGIAEEILNVLAHVNGLHVASRTSSFQFRKTDLGAPAIAQKLGVRHILEGSVRKAGTMVRITAQLIDAPSDRHLWSQTFDRPLTTANLFEIQDEIAKTIVGQLTTTIGSVPGAVIPVATTTLVADTADVDAYDLYLQGRALFIARTTQNLSKAASVLKQALGKDPKFARAWATLAAVYAVSEAWRVRDLTDYQHAALDAAATATRLDPKLSLPFAARGMVQSNLIVRDQRTSWEESLASLTQAIANDPKEATAYAWRSSVFRSLGYLDRARADLQQCLAIDPAYELCRRHLALAELLQGHVDASLSLYETGLQRGYLHSDDYLFAPSLAARGDRIGALGILVQAYQDTPDLIGPLFRSITDRAFSDRDRQEAINFVSAGLLDYEQRLEAFWILKAYDQIAPVPLPEAPLIWWVAGDTGWLRSPTRKIMMKQWRLPEYWRRHGFPPQCKAIGESDFECR